MFLSFYFIRHGQSEANAGGYPAGQMDSPLTAKGRAEAEALSDLLGFLDPKPQYIVTSHLSRSRETAAILNRRHKLPVIEKRELAEQHYGAFQGQSKEMLRERYGGNWYDMPPDGESFALFQMRIKSALRALSENPYGLPLIVGHGGMVKALGRLYNDQISDIKNCCLYYFDAEKGQGDMPWTMCELTSDGEFCPWLDTNEQFLLSPVSHQAKEGE